MPNGTGSSGSIPPDLIAAIASSTAMSVGEQPAILANLALANQIANTNLAQQNAISNQQAMFHLELTIVSKCVELIASINPTSATASQQLEAFQKVMEAFSNLSKSSINSPPAPAATAPPSQAETTPPAASTASNKGATNRSKK
jgi:hypothetical protein